jgi:UDP-2,3-diacylglucosamine pyrophosphatase LpxH
MKTIVQQILSNSFKKAKRISLDKHSKIIFFSDVHRGNNSYADDFAHNRTIYLHALKTYYEAGFTYFELGDGFELWENHNFKEIFAAYKHSLLLLKKFKEEGRLHFLWGNHDMIFKKHKHVKKYFDFYSDEITGEKKEFLKNSSFEESIILEVDGLSKNILLIHGHQADFFNYVLWKWSRFLVRFLWKPLQIIGIKDPTSPAKNYKGLIKVEENLKKWILANNNQMVIAGHTHRPRFPEPGELPYFNDGSCVHPRAITGIEINNLEISLIKWHTISKTDGTLQIVKSILDGPEKLSSYLDA